MRDLADARRKTAGFDEGEMQRVPVWVEIVSVARSTISMYAVPSTAYPAIHPPIRSSTSPARTIAEGREVYHSISARNSAFERAVR